MKPVAHLTHVRELEKALAEEYVSLSQLMYAAGTSLADRVLDVLAQQPCVDPRPVVIFVGSGNNGGDGWVAAESLQDTGVEVSVITPCDPTELTSEPAALMAKQALIAQVPYLVNPSEQVVADLLIKAGVVVDAILGTGFEPRSGEPSMREPYRTWIHLINRHSSTYVVSVDVPSGVNAQTGELSDTFVKADETVTMLTYKPGLLEPRIGEQAAGQIHLAPLFDPSHLVNRYEEYLASLATLPRSGDADGSGEDSAQTCETTVNEEADDTSSQRSSSTSSDLLGFTSSFTLDIFGKRKKQERPVQEPSQGSEERIDSAIGTLDEDGATPPHRSHQNTKTPNEMNRDGTRIDSADGTGDTSIEDSDYPVELPDAEQDTLSHNSLDPASSTAKSAEQYDGLAAPDILVASDQTTRDLSHRAHQEQVAKAEDLMRRHTCARVLDLEDYAGLLPPLYADANKYARGHLYVVGGSHAYPGAAVLAARAAEQSGAGYVRVVAEEPSVLQHHLVSTPVEPWPAFNHLSEGHMTQWLGRLNRAHALVVGPGLGSQSSGSYSAAEQLVRMAVSQVTVPLILDADALNILAYLTKGSPSDLGMLLARIPAPVILTPHAGEFGRMMRTRLDAQPSAARPHTLAQRIEHLTTLLQIFIRAGAINTIVVYKGDRTLVGYASLPHDQAKIYLPTIDLPDAGPPSLARAGTGDVLAGILGSLIAQAHAGHQRRNEPLTAQHCASLASLAVYAHGEAGWRAFDALSSHRSITPIDICDLLGISLDTIDQEACAAATHRLT